MTSCTEQRTSYNVVGTVPLGFDWWSEGDTVRHKQQMVCWFLDSGVPLSATAVRFVLIVACGAWGCHYQHFAGEMGCGRSWVSAGDKSVTVPSDPYALVRLRKYMQRFERTVLLLFILRRVRSLFDPQERREMFRKRLRGKLSGLWESKQGLIARGISSHVVCALTTQSLSCPKNGSFYWRHKRPLKK